ncbi:MAG: molecular chaperone DnaJ [unclassified Hahellaceae]|nr:molecular chaperone DnaJ [Hahellaceae bacterium]
MLRISTVLVILILVGCTSSQVDREPLGYEGRDSPEDSVEELFSELQSNPEVTIKTEGGWRVADVPSERALYSFTPESHPAHPSFVKREVVEKNGSINIRTSVKCGAEKSACDQLVRDFIELNNKVRGKVEAGGG